MSSFALFSTYTWAFSTSVLLECTQWTLKSAFMVKHASQLPYSSCNPSTEYIESGVFQFEWLQTKYITQLRKQQCSGTLELCNPLPAISSITLAQFLHQGPQRNPAVYSPQHQSDTCSIQLILTTDSPLNQFSSQSPSDVLLQLS